MMECGGDYCQRLPLNTVSVETQVDPVLESSGTEQLHFLPLAVQNDILEALTSLKRIQLQTLDKTIKEEIQKIHHLLQRHLSPPVAKPESTSSTESASTDLPNLANSPEPPRDLDKIAPCPVKIAQPSVSKKPSRLKAFFCFPKTHPKLISPKASKSGSGRLKLWGEKAPKTGAKKSRPKVLKLLKKSLSSSGHHVKAQKVASTSADDYEVSSCSVTSSEAESLSAYLEQYVDELKSITEEECFSDKSFNRSLHAEDIAHRKFDNEVDQNSLKNPETPFCATSTPEPQKTASIGSTSAPNLDSKTESENSDDAKSFKSFDNFSILLRTDSVTTSTKSEDQSESDQSSFGRQKRLEILSSCIDDTSSYEESKAGGKRYGGDGASLSSGSMKSAMSTEIGEIKAFLARCGDIKEQQPVAAWRQDQSNSASIWRQDQSIHNADLIDGGKIKEQREPRKSVSLGQVHFLEPESISPLSSTHSQISNPITPDSRPENLPTTSSGQGDRSTGPATRSSSPHSSWHSSENPVRGKNLSGGGDSLPQEASSSSEDVSPAPAWVYDADSLRDWRQRSKVGRQRSKEGALDAADNTENSGTTSVWSMSDLMSAASDTSLESLSSSSANSDKSGSLGNAKYVGNCPKNMSSAEEVPNSRPSSCYLFTSTDRNSSTSLPELESSLEDDHHAAAACSEWRSGLARQMETLENPMFTAGSRPVTVGDESTESLDISQQQHSEASEMFEKPNVPVQAQNPLEFHENSPSGRSHRSELRRSESERNQKLNEIWNLQDRCQILAARISIQTKWGSKPEFSKSKHSQQNDQLPWMLPASKKTTDQNCNPSDPGTISINQKFSQPFEINPDSKVKNQKSGSCNEVSSELSGENPTSSGENDDLLNRTMSEASIEMGLEERSVSVTSSNSDVSDIEIEISVKA